MNRADSSFRRLTDVVEYLVDEEVGVVRFLREMPRDAGSPELFHYYAQACNTAAFSELGNFSWTGGASTDRGIAMAKALGEAVERYCSAIFELEELPLASYERADFPCVPPGDFALHSREQYAAPGFTWVPFNPDTTVSWTPARDLLSGETVYVPAAMVYVPFVYWQERQDHAIVQPISTGLACHCSLAEAAINGICEVIERDAFTLTWQAGLSCPQLSIETLSPSNRDLIARLNRANYEITLLDITTDVGVPTVLSVSRNESTEAPALVFAASANLDPEQAVRKSLEELDHTGEYCRKIKRYFPRLVAQPDYSNVVSQQDHLNFWGDHAHARLADFIFASAARVDFKRIHNLSTGDPQLDLRTLLEKVRSINHRVLLSELTTPDVGELGLKVVRAVIPGFNPLFVGHTQRTQGGRRLLEALRRPGEKGIVRAAGGNQLPHPYP